MEADDTLSALTVKNTPAAGRIGLGGRLVAYESSTCGTD